MSTKKKKKIIKKGKRKTQRWRCFFETKREIKGKHTLNLRNLVFHIEPITKTRAKGYLEFSFMKDYISKRDAQEMAEKHFQLITRIFHLGNNSGINPNYKSFKLINSKNWKHGPIGIPTSTSFTIKLRVREHPLIQEDFNSLETIYRKLDQFPQKNKLIESLEWINKESKDRKENFIYNWIAFNILFRINNRSTDVKAISKFCSSHPDKNSVEKLLKKYTSLAKDLSKNSLISWHGNKNYSKELKQVLKSNSSRPIFRLMLLCMNIIRNQLLHSGHYDDQILFDGNSFLNDVVRTSVMSLTKSKSIFFLERKSKNKGTKITAK